MSTAPTDTDLDTRESKYPPIGVFYLDDTPKLLLERAKRAQQRALKAGADTVAASYELDLADACIVAAQAFLRRVRSDL